LAAPVMSTTAGAAVPALGGRLACLFNF
jgi:hypothetical protein